MSEPHDKSKFPTLIHQRVAEAKAGKNPFVICKLETAWLVMRDTQPLDGCCIILSDPVVSSLNDLPEEVRMRYCRDMARVGDALLKVTGAFRINYETWGNLDQALHTHIVPRYASEPDAKRTSPACMVYDFGGARKFDRDTDAPFVQKMRQALSEFLAH
jgi:diadenosine tetraphosphate (Ap4A) HIT family hydrolase